jgi:hypothetical protein
MIEAVFLRRDYTWKLRDGSQSMLCHLRVSDNYIRLYLKNILPNLQKIERGSFDARSLTTLPVSEALMDYQFENLVL